MGQLNFFQIVDTDRIFMTHSCEKNLHEITHNAEFQRLTPPVEEEPEGVGVGEGRPREGDQG